MEDLISKTKILEWLKIREEEAYANAAQTFSPSLFKGKADAFNDVAAYVSSGHFDPIPLPTIKPGDKVVITDAMNEYFIGTKAIVEKISKSAPYSAKLKGIHGEWPLSSLEVSHD
ncbi:hypothetical protein J25TS5_04270 [Paenibacillus faecis]|uniref:hypothetical protein n=1 Tax=Paenibacillus faecis TaxID=862114 RepID=UPI001B095158|nr:hypothetical protein [Paenibacillus faecis]GIO83495.1 hypothetical protein J25TS5_04270 [Paenibacillus faecis]